MILLLEDLKFIIFIHYSHFLNMCYLLGVCNSVSMLCKIISDAFPVKLNDLFLVTSLWVLIFAIIISFLNVLHILFPWLCTLLSLFLFISFFLPYNYKKRNLYSSVLGYPLPLILSLDVQKNKLLHPHCLSHYLLKGDSQNFSVYHK